jgi:hypothetical protein
MANIKDALVPGGIFTGQFFGPHDSWRGKLNITVYDEAECRNFLAGLELVYFKEEERDGPIALGGDKHWHLFNFIARQV